MIYNWRRILSDDFTGDYKHESMSFDLDGNEWNTVTHYLIGMIYKNTPAYSALFSLENRKDNGYWGNVKSAVDAHIRNVRAGRYPTDPEFEKNSNKYLLMAYLAKFTQNPIAKKILLLTGDAIISKRGGPKGIIDIDTYAIVREQIRNNPRMVFKGDGIIEQSIEDFPMIVSSEELNSGNIGNPKDLNVDFINQIPVLEQDCIVYLATGIHNLDIAKMINIFGERNYIYRHVYGLERITDNKNDGIMVSLQRMATSIQKEYIIFSPDLNIDATIYLEQFISGFGIFIISSEMNQLVYDLLKQILMFKLDI